MLPLITLLRLVFFLVLIIVDASECHPLKTNMDLPPLLNFLIAVALLVAALFCTFHVLQNVACGYILYNRPYAPAEKLLFDIKSVCFLAAQNLQTAISLGFPCRISFSSSHFSPSLIFVKGKGEKCENYQKLENDFFKKFKKIRFLKNSRFYLLIIDPTAFKH